MRRALGWMMVAGAFVLAVFAYFGNALLFAFYLAALGNAVAFHWWYACSRCTNVCCPFNVRNPDFFARFRPMRMVGQPVHEFSDIRCLVAAGPLVLAGLIGVVAAWLWSHIAAVGWLVAMGALAVWFSKVSCVGCGNDCPVNRNAAYRAWKKDAG